MMTRYAPLTHRLRHDPITVNIECDAHSNPLPFRRQNENVAVACWTGTFNFSNSLMVNGHPRVLKWNYEENRRERHHLSGQ